MTPLPRAGEGGAKRRVRARDGANGRAASAAALTLARFARISLSRTREREFLDRPKQNARALMARALVNLAQR